MVVKHNTSDNVPINALRRIVSLNLERGPLILEASFVLFLTTMCRVVSLCGELRGLVLGIVLITSHQRFNID